MMYISPELEWTRPFLKKVKHLAPIHKLEKIVSVKADIKKIQHVHGQLVTSRWVDNNRIERQYISIYLSYPKIIKLKPLKRVIKPYSKLDTLVVLAHELAHFDGGTDHTTKHRRLENRIMNIFMNLLDKNGYVSEEHEMKHNRPNF